MIWVVLLAGAAALFALLWGLQRRSLQQAARSLREIGSGEAGRRLRLETPGKTMEELIREVNRMLDEKQQARSPTAAAKRSGGTRLPTSPTTSARR